MEAIRARWCPAEKKSESLRRTESKWSKHTNSTCTDYGHSSFTNTPAAHKTTFSRHFYRLLDGRSWPRGQFTWPSSSVSNAQESIFFRSGHAADAGRRSFQRRSFTLFLKRFQANVRMNIGTFIRCRQTNRQNNENITFIFNTFVYNWGQSTIWKSQTSWRAKNSMYEASWTEPRAPTNDEGSFFSQCRCLQFYVIKLSSHLTDRQKNGNQLRTASTVGNLHSFIAVDNRT